ncbi:antibiotic biosynthesis monooxygenase [Thiosocius teredinicola]|uniref:antibiotic biosynthesis monooxygenase n=1 Tax=Thiosocius teredinicola TaxID=1973002 RepID=UPI00099120D5
MNPEERMPDDDDEPVTVLVTRRPIAGMQREFEAYLHGITEAASKQPGHLGTTIFRPSGTKDRAYRILFRFDKRSNLARWEQSEEREQWRERAAVVSEPREAVVETGLEAWFTVPNCDVPAHPPKVKMALVVWLGIFLIVTTLMLILMPWISHWHLIPRTLLFTGIVVALMTWVVMPLLTRWFAGWLHPKR